MAVSRAARPALFALAAVAVLAALAPAQVAAQIPLPGTGGAGVDVKADATSLSVSVDEAGKVNVLVTNTGTASGTPLDQARDVTLEVSGNPPAWVVSIEPARFSLAPGQTGTAVLKVAVPADATESVSDLTVTARMFPVGAAVIPGVGPAVDPEYTDTDHVKVTRQDAPQRVLLETVGPYIWILLLALVAAVVVIVTLVAANRRVAVRLSTDDAAGQLAPGTRFVFPFKVHNLTRRPDAVVLRVSPLPEGWATFLPTAQFELEGNAVEDGSVVVIPPKDAAVGTQQTIVVTATSAQAPRRPATVAFTATVAEKRKLAPAKAPAQA